MSEQSPDPGPRMDEQGRVLCLCPACKAEHTEPPPVARPRGFAVTLTHPDGRTMPGLRFRSADAMRRFVTKFARHGWTAGPIITLERHELATCVEVLRPKAGDVLVIRHPAGVDLHRHFYEAAVGIARRTGCRFVLAPEGVRLEALDEDALRRAGWVRAEEFMPPPDLRPGDMWWRNAEGRVVVRRSAPVGAVPDGVCVGHIELRDGRFVDVRKGELSNEPGGPAFSVWPGGAVEGEPDSPLTVTAPPPAP